MDNVSPNWLFNILKEIGIEGAGESIGLFIASRLLGGRQTVAKVEAANKAGNTTEATHEFNTNWLGWGEGDEALLWYSVAALDYYKGEYKVTAEQIANLVTWFGGQLTPTKTKIRKALAKMPSDHEQLLALTALAKADQNAWANMMNWQQDDLAVVKAAFDDYRQFDQTTVKRWVDETAAHVAAAEAQHRHWPGLLQSWTFGLISPERLIKYGVSRKAYRIIVWSCAGALALGLTIGLMFAVFAK